MKIKLTDNRGIWLDGKQQAAGYETTLADVTGKALIASGLAVEVVNAAKIENKKFQALKPKAKFNAD